MTNMENWVNKNSEVETEDKENGAVVLTGAADEQIVEDENTSDDVVEVVDETSEETGNEVADDATVDETTDTEESEENEEEEVSDENSEDENDESDEEAKEGMSRTEKIVLTVLAIILFLLLLWFGIKVYNNIQRGAEDARNLNNSQITSTQTDNDKENNGDNDNDGANSSIVDGQDDKTDDSDKNIGNRPDKPSSTDTDNDNDGKDDDGSDKKNNSSTDSSEEDGKNNDDGDSDGDDDGNGGNSDSDSSDDGNGNDNKVSEYAGETTVRITKVTDETGIITVTVDGEKIVVPVQTTVFNGRVTKSGVAQGKLFGFNCGATVMLFYPQEDGMNNTEFSGYMNRSGDSLTILVDINGDDSKLLIKINGLKSL